MGEGEGEGDRQTDNQFSSVAQLCLTLCNPMNHSTPGLPVHHQLPGSDVRDLCLLQVSLAFPMHSFLGSVLSVIEDTQLYSGLLF